MASQAWMHSPWRKMGGYIVLLVAATVGFGLLLFVGPGKMHLDGAKALRHAAAAASDTVSDGNIYTGSFVVVPPGGYQCWKLSFDNRTGRTWGGRYLDCNAATETIENQLHRNKKKNSLRMRAISATFHK